MCNKTFSISICLFHMLRFDLEIDGRFRLRLSVHRIFDHSGSPLIWANVDFCNNLKTVFPILLQYQQICFSTRLMLTAWFSVFHTIQCEPERWFCVKISADHQFLKLSDELVWHYQPCHIQIDLNSLFFPHSDGFTSRAKIVTKFSFISLQL